MVTESHVGLLWTISYQAERTAWSNLSLSPLWPHLSNSQQICRGALFSPATYVGSLHRFYSLCENTQAVVSDVSIFKLESVVGGHSTYIVTSLLEHELHAENKC